MIQSFRTLLLAIILSIGISYAYAAWAPPTQAPTGGNAEAPVNVGNATQLKAGGLGVNGLLHAYSNAVVDQKMGIGITSPIGPLTINDTSGSPWVDIRSNGDANNYSAISLWSSNGGAWPVFSGADSNKRWAIGHRKLAGEVNNFFIEECNGNCLQGNPVNYAQRLTIKPGGNVGIGTTNPTVKLDIAGGIKVGDTSTCTPGTIRFRGGDFEGCVGGATWKSLTVSGSSSSGPQQYQCPTESVCSWGGVVTGNCNGQVTTSSTCTKGTYYAAEGGDGCTATTLSCTPI